MARGLPAFWSGVVAAVFAGFGLLIQSNSQVHDQVGTILMVLGGIIFVTGIFVQFRAPGKPSRIDPETASVYHPTQRYAAWHIASGIVLFIIGVYVLYFTQIPYAYPGIALAFGMYRVGRGLHRYWANSLTTYYISKDDMLFLKSYRFISQDMRPANAKNIDTMPSGQNVIERLFDIGHADVILRNQTYSVRDIADFEKFKDEMSPLLNHTS
jgi:hypothetical protein